MKLLTAPLPSPTESAGQTHRAGSVLQEMWTLVVTFPEKQEDRGYAGLPETCPSGTTAYQ